MGLEFQVIDVNKIRCALAENSFKDEILHQLLEACSNTGFFYVKNHGIDQKLIDEMFSTSKVFFSTPEKDKKAYSVVSNIGYCSIGQERLSDEFPLDYKEAFNFPPTTFLKEEIKLPSVFSEKEKIINDFTEGCCNLSEAILSGIALSLGLELDYFTRAHKPSEPSGSILRVLHYPPVTPSLDLSKMIRAGSHSDYGTLTMLFQEISPKGASEIASGLQISIPDKDNNGGVEWVDVPAKEGCIVVNVADLLAFWTEGRLVSAIHRVVLPKADLSHLSRYSIAYFLHPDNDYPINFAPSSLPAPHPAEKLSDGTMKASFGPSEFIYGETGKAYLQRRLDKTY